MGVDFISVIVTDFVAHVPWRRRVGSDPANGQLKILERAFALTQTALDEGASRHLRALGIVNEDVKIIPSAHETKACEMGAVAMVLDDILREPAFV